MIENENSESIEQGIPSWVKLEDDIPGYSDMVGYNQDHYKRLYTKAYYPNLLRIDDIPDAQTDIQALVYFIFYHNLAYCREGEEIKKILPLLSFFWSQRTGFIMSVQRGQSESLLPTVYKLADNPKLYFIALMLAIALFQANNSGTPDYRFLFRLLDSLLTTGKYAKPFNSADRSFINQSGYAWFFKYLPSPEKIDFSAIIQRDNVRDARQLLIGETGIFKKPRVETAESSWPCCLIT